MTYKEISDLIKKSNAYKKDGVEVVIYCGINAYRDLRSKCVKSLFGSTETGDDTFNDCRIVIDKEQSNYITVWRIK